MMTDFLEYLGGRNELLTATQIMSSPNGSSTTEDTHNPPNKTLCKEIGDSNYIGEFHKWMVIQLKIYEKNQL